MLLPVITLISFIISLNHSVWIWFHHSVNFCVQKIGFVHLDTGLRIFKIFYAAFFGHHVEHKLNGNEIYSFLSDLPQHNNVRWYSCAVLTSFPQFEGRKVIRPDRCQCFRRFRPSWWFGNFNGVFCFCHILVDIFNFSLVL